MTDNTDKGLLPAGLSDVLTPDATFESSVLERLLADFATHGYDRVNPPLVEFEDSLLNGIGAGVAEQTFRLMDPESQKMMGIRADMTPQIARIAARRLSQAPRPLRLSYAGQVLRVRGSQLRPERQFTQVGAELIGPDEAAADAEVIVLAARALANLGVDDLSIDLGLPKLVAAVSGNAGDNPESEARFRQALDRKDATAVAELGDDFGEDAARTLAAMLNAAGPATEALETLGALGLNSEAESGRNLLADVVERVRAALPDLAVTIDPVENRGFEYHTGVTVTFFAKGVRGELGSGGRYMANGGDNAGEAATGFTLFMDTVLRALAPPAPRQRVYLPAGTLVENTARLRADGYITVAALSDEKNAAGEAERLGCSHVLQEGEVVEISKTKAKSKD